MPNGPFSHISGTPVEKRRRGGWLSQHYDDLGVRNTLDLSWIYDESLKPAHLPEDAARGAAIKEAAG
jgi:hypothetical protein